MICPTVLVSRVPFPPEPPAPLPRRDRGPFAGRNPPRGGGVRRAGAGERSGRAASWSPRPATAPSLVPPDEPPAGRHGPAPDTVVMADREDGTDDPPAARSTPAEAAHDRTPVTAEPVPDPPDPADRAAGLPGLGRIGVIVKTRDRRPDRLVAVTMPLGGALADPAAAEVVPHRGPGHRPRSTPARRRGPRRRRERRRGRAVLPGEGIFARRHAGRADRRDPVALGPSLGPGRGRHGRAGPRGHRL